MGSGYVVGEVAVFGEWVGVGEVGVEATDPQTIIEIISI